MKRHTSHSLVLTCSCIVLLCPALITIVSGDSEASNPVPNPSPPLDLEKYESPVDDNDTPEEGAITLAFVFDVTGSMWDDLVQVIDGADKILQTVLSRREGLLHNYVLVPFHDPEIGPATITTDHRVFQNHLRELYVQGGGDCPETSIGAIKMALELCLPNSFIYVFTDASSKDYYLLPDVLTLVQRKQIQVIFVMTGDCGEPQHPGHLAYERIASTSSGQVFHLVKSDVDQVLNFVRVSLQARKVNLLAVDQKIEGEATLPLVVDSSLREFTVSLSGDNPQVELVNPRGNIVNESTGAEELLNINNVHIVNVKEPEQGTWNVKLSSNSSHTVRATGLSSVDFLYGFSVMPTSNLQETYHRPLQGALTYLVINAIDLPLNANLESVDLIDLSGELLRVVPLRSADNSENGVYLGAPFHPPNEFFYLKLKGFNEMGFPIQRISPTAVSSQSPGVPEVMMRIHNGTHHGGSVNFVCHILSLLPFSLSWYRGINNDTLLKGPDQYQQTSEVIFTIDDVTTDREDHYSCVATNVAGPGSSSVYLDIKDPPPIIKKMQDRTFQPGTKAILICVAKGALPIEISWSRYDSGNQRPRFMSDLIKSNSRITDFANGTLIIKEVDVGDEGWYRCTAQNEGGSAHQKVYLTIQKPPTVTLSPKDITFSKGESIILKCEAIGIPVPTVEWLKDGQLMLHSQRTDVGGETLTLLQATPDDSGDYECRAHSSAGSDSKITHVKYIEPPFINKEQDRQFARLGDPATLSCTGHVGIPAGRIHWKRGNESLPRRKAKLRLPSSDVHRGDLPIEEVDGDDEDDVDFDDEKFELLDGGTTLRFQTEITDAGQFVCEARNDAGQDQHTITLVVYDPPRITSPENGEVKSFKGGVVTLPCVASGYPTADISWTKDGVSFLKQHPYGSVMDVVDLRGKASQLTIPNASVPASGLYTCIAENEYGKAWQKTEVTILDGPNIDKTGQGDLEIIYGSDMILVCSVTGHPPPVITWSRNDSTLESMRSKNYSTNLNLLLEDVTAESAGQYTCTASNEVKTDQLQISLRVLVPPSVERIEEYENREILEGRPVTLTCPITSLANPKPTVTWKKNGLPLSLESKDASNFNIGNDGLSLTIAETRIADTVFYTCIATNQAGKVEYEFFLDILVAPKFEKDSIHDTIEVIKDHLVMLDCTVLGTPRPIILWSQFVNGWKSVTSGERIIIDENTLTIKQSDTVDAGLYYCVAENKAGVIKREFNVTVLVPPIIEENNHFGQQRVLNGSNHELICTAHGDPIPDVEWLKEGIKMSADSYQNSNDSVVLTSVSSLASHQTQATLRFGPIREYDGGRYTCRTENKAGHQEKDTILEVTVPPYFLDILPVDDGEAITVKITINSPLVLECPAVGSPTPTITWHRSVPDLETIESDGKFELLENGRRLRLNAARKEDDRPYTCRAVNEGGSIERNFLVEFETPPVIYWPRNGKDGLSTVNGLEGESLTLKCLAEGNPRPLLSWYLDGLPMKPHLFPRVIFEEGHLVINRLQQQDGGNYVCVAENKIGSAEKDFEVNILSLPSLEIPLEKLDTFPLVRINRPVTFNCPVSGYPTPDIMWLKDGKPLDPSENNNIVISADGRNLKLSRSQVEDEGIYTCVAQNIAGETNVDFTLQVQVPPKIATDHIQSKINGKENESIVLECPVIAHPFAVITWLKAGELLSNETSKDIAFESDNQRLIIGRLTSLHAGQFTCIASNEAGATEQNYQVKVQVPPKLDSTDLNSKPTVMINRAIVLVCPTIGSPLPSVKWYKNGLSLHNSGDPSYSFSVDGRRLKLRRARPEDAAIYKCIAYNDVGKSEQEFDLTVQVPPKFVQENLSSGEGFNGNLEAVEHGTVEMLCEVLGTPEPTIIWLKEGRWLELDDVVELPVSAADASNAGLTDNRGTVVSEEEIVAGPTPIQPLNHLQLLRNGQLLRIHNVSVDNSGRYTCVASNVVGSVEKDFDVDILVPPKIQGADYQKLTAIVNRPVTLECPVEPVNPQPSIVWLKDDRPLSLRRSIGPPLTVINEGLQLHFGRIMAADAGSYTCIATNIIARKEKHFDVDVQVPPVIVSTNSGFVVISGQPTLFECVTTGNPKPNIVWLKDGELYWKESQFPKGILLLDDGQRLIINNTLPKHSGRFTCMATNEIGAIEKDILLDVIAPPSMADLTMTQRSLSVLVNHPVKIECPVTTDNGLEMSWSKNYIPLNATADDPFVHLTFGGRVLQVIRTREDDGGLYRCRAINAAGVAESDFQLQILVPPIIESPLGDHDGPSYILENHDADFECYVSGNPKPTVKWIKDGQDIFGSEKVKGDDERNEKLHLLASGQHLHIKDVGLSDSGHYTCLASSTSGSRERDFYLTVQAPPVIDLATRTEEAAILHYPALLQCLVKRGSPEPSIKWMRNGAQIDQITDSNVQITNNGHQLHILRSKLSDRGKYTCLASNAAGSDNITISLDIHVAPTIDRSNIRGTTTVIVNGTLVLECPASGHPSPVVTWTKNGKAIIGEFHDEFESKSFAKNASESQHSRRNEILSDGKILRIASIQLDDIGNFQCSAHNIAGKDQTEHNVDVVVPPVINNLAVQPLLQVIEGQEASLSCPVFGIPSPNVMWLKDGNVFSPHHYPNWDIASTNRNQENVSSVRLVKAHPNDSGRYTCVASNIFGTAELDMDLEVLVRPSIVPAPDTTTVQQIEGHSIILECNPRGHPTPIMRWTRGDTEIKPSESTARQRLLYNKHRLQIESSQVEDDGEYTCFAESSVGSAQHTFQLAVLAPPRIVASQLDSIVNAISNTDATLSCPVTGTPQPRIVWYKESQLLFSGGHISISDNGTKLTISKTRKHDIGRYICLATNDAGTLETDILLNVLVIPTIEGEENVDPELHLVIMNEALTLECQVRGFPPPAIAWFKHDEPLTNDSSTRISITDGGRSFKIVRALPEDDDTYACLAENDAGGAEKLFRVDVLIPPGVEVPQTKQFLQVISGHPLSIECSSSGDPPPVIVWLKNGYPLKVSQRLTMTGNEAKVFAEEAIPSDGADYTCLATNDAGTSEQEFNVRILVPPEIKDSKVMENVSAIAYHPIRLECPATGNPVPKIIWKKDGHQINSSAVSAEFEEIRYATGQKLQIFVSLPNEEGIYICEATNVAGSVQKMFNISIWQPPTFANDYFANQQITRQVGDNLTLSCYVNGHPTPQISWYKNNEPILLSDSNSRYQSHHNDQELQVLNISTQFAGRFRCVASNVVGNVSKQYDVDIIVPPSININRTADVKVNINERADLFCHATGTPSPHITWSRSGLLLSEGSAGHHMQLWSNALTFPSVRVQDDGTFTCTATNNAGSVSYNITLEVLVPPSILDGPSDIGIKSGSNISLPCQVKGRPFPKVFWKKDTEVAHSEQGFQIQPDGSLFIPNAQLRHAATYTCIARNTAGSKSVQKHLSVHVPPEIKSEQLAQYTSVRGNDVVLDCRSEGHPTPNTVWDFQGQPIEFGQQRKLLLPDGGLKILSVEPSDMGNFRCTVQNVAGSAERNVDLVVLVPPKIDRSLHQERKVVLAGRSVQLSCQTEGYPIPSVVWSFDGLKMSTEARGELWIEQAKPVNSGKYVCIAQNEAGRDNLEIVLEVQAPPTFTLKPADTRVAVGSRAEISCSVQGTPRPQIYWLRNNVPVNGAVTSDTGKNTLIIDNVQVDDGGIYSCRATNPSGDISATMTISVIVPPRITHRPENTVAQQGTTVILTCGAEGDPQPDIIWTKDGHRLQTVAGVPQEGWLILEHVQASDEGLYKCVASNIGGNAEISVELTVLVEPIFMIKPQHVVVDSGESTILDCRADGNPAPEMRWLKDGYPLHQMDHRLVVLRNYSFQLVSAQILDEGTYECEASSELGSIKAQAKILVRVNGMWSSWSDWGICSSTCGHGTQLRQRQCNNPPPRQSGLPCNGIAQESKRCTNKPCPVDGGWGSWAPWSACSESCGKGLQTRRRICDSPMPQYGGRLCVGEYQESSTCISSVCNVAGQWSSWETWSPCTQSCGGGVRVRVRKCNGKECIGESTQSDYCKNDLCPVHGGWGSWTGWGDCSASCNGGQRRRFRTCNEPSPSQGGRTCPGTGQDMEMCNVHRCPEHGNWASWSAWSSCSAKCGRGTRDRFRSCSNPAPRFGGRRCFGDATQVEECIIQLCNALPSHSIGNLLGNINGQDIGLSPLTANFTTSGDQTVVTATIENLLPDAGNCMRVLSSLLSQVYWTFATEIGQAANGYSLTKGFFARDTEASFVTGETVKITHVGRGLQSSGALLVDVVVTGNIPEFSSDAEVVLDPYTEDYIQTGKGTLYATSSRTFAINGYTLPYAWNHSIQYDEDYGYMPFLIEKLSVNGISAKYYETNNTLWFAMQSSITKGIPSNQCPIGFILHSNGLSCDDVDECLRNKPCSHVCTNVIGSYSCKCPTGFTLGPDGSNCEDVDECQLATDNCGPRQTCENTLGSFRCVSTCDAGFQRSSSGLECHDVDECGLQPQLCDQKCFNFFGGYRCDCRPGYELFGQTSCIDIDECEKNEQPCSHGCLNTHGSFMCTCQKGYSLLDDTECEDNDECFDGTHNCQHQQNCVNIPGSFICKETCQTGYSVNSHGSCVDINECDKRKDLCHSTQQCENLPGSYKCTCPHGFQAAGPEKPCKDYNECTNEGLCQHKCENTIGSFKCHCPKGYRVSGNGRTCQDIDECTEEEINCGADKICFNMRGSYRCMDAPCPELFTREKRSGDCVLDCERSDTLCPNGVTNAEILSYKMVSLASGIQPYEDLVRLVAFDTDEKPLSYTHFKIDDNNSGVPFQVRQEDGQGILYTLKSLDRGTEFSIIAIATSYNPAKTVVHYTTKFIIFIAIAEYPY